ncbi:hypothetical protein T484DRAFT_1793013 [Baffinella frigidus]|nr:hypothetical protein T484DRAFT_1793013 [Cryptophyta sp. CCMP2293]
MPNYPVFRPGFPLTSSDEGIPRVPSHPALTNTADEGIPRVPSHPALTNTTSVRRV